jgi:uncharacterized protein YozE (UPF0346 family)
MMTQRVHKKVTAIDYFAEAMVDDLAFPKHATDYHQVSRYLEDEVNYLNNLSIFDEAWEDYLASEA